uniref:Uncharacterized protein n=1 Tax=Glossina pallidipes TaxID=7398 RepID=A0A1A9Z684_GLOPL
MHSSSLGKLCASIVFFPKQGGRAVDKVEASSNECHDIFVISGTYQLLLRSSSPSITECLVLMTVLFNGWELTLSVLEPQRNPGAQIIGDIVYLTEPWFKQIWHSVFAAPFSRLNPAGM